MMKKFLYILFCSIWILGCSQDPKQQSVSPKTDVKKMYDINKYIFPEAKEITEANFVEKLSSQIKHYDKEPIYYLRINKQSCLIEVEVNDIYLYNDFQISNIITPVEIGYILKSGEQKVTVKMYPVGNLLNESWGKTDGKPMTELSENSEVSIEVISIDEKSPKGLNDEKEITKITSPKEAAGNNYYEFSFTFNADVPYIFDGWTKGQDLSKLDQDLVKRKGLEFYKMIGEMHLKKDINSWLKLNYCSDLRIMSSSFISKQYLNELLADYKTDVEGHNYKMNPIIDYTLDYMGNGKLLMLKNSSELYPHRGGGTLSFTYGKKGIYLPGIILYLPEGRDLATQGFMMWK